MIDGHKIGEIVQYERQGEADDRYRRLVRMQIQSILSSAGTTAVLLEIVRIWTDAEAPVYVEPPLGRAELQIGATLAAGLDDAGPLLMFLRRAKPGGVRLSLLETDGDGLLLDYTPASPVTGAGLTDYTPASPVTGAGTLVPDTVPSHQIYAMRGFDFTPPANVNAGSTTINVTANSYQDAVGNLGSASNTITISYN